MDEEPQIVNAQMASEYLDKIGLQFESKDSCSSTCSRFRLLKDREPIPADAEYLETDCETWTPVESHYVGKRYNAQILQPFRCPANVNCPVSGEAD